MDYATAFDNLMDAEGQENLASALHIMREECADAHEFVLTLRDAFPDNSLLAIDGAAEAAERLDYDLAARYLIEDDDD